MGLENSKALPTSYTYPFGSVSGSETPKQKKRSRVSAYDDNEQPVKRSNSAPVGILDQYKCRLFHSSTIDNIPIVVSGSTPNIQTDIITKNYDYSIFWKETDLFSLHNSMYQLSIYLFNSLDRLKCRELPAYVLPKLPPLADELSKHVIKAFPPDPGLYQPIIISKVVQNLQLGKRGNELRESLYQGYYPCSNDVINVINHITTDVMYVRQKYLADLASMYLKYPYIRSTIIQSIDCYIREQIEHQKETLDPTAVPMDYCSELIRILSTDMKLFNNQLISTILSLLYVDYKMLYYKSIVYYMKNACQANPFYTDFIFSHILKRWRSFPSVIQMLAIELIENVYKLTPVNIIVKYHQAIMTRLTKCLESQHNFIMSQAQVTIASIQMRMISSYSTKNYNSVVSVAQAVSCN